TFKYQDYFDAAPSTGYETLIYDCMIGDAILFQRADGVEAGWRVVQPFLDAWRGAGPNGLALYEAGSEGPNEANQLLARDGRRWRHLREQRSYRNSERPHRQQIFRCSRQQGDIPETFNPRPSSRVFPELPARRSTGRVLTASAIHCNSWRRTRCTCVSASNQWYGSQPNRL